MNNRMQEKPEREQDAFEDWLRPLVNEGFDRIGGPGAHVLDAITKEARASARRRRFVALSTFISRPALAVAAAAALVLLAGAAVLAHHTLRASRHTNTLNLLLDLGSAQTSHQPRARLESAEFAQRLLAVQGLDEEAYMASAETESLSL